MSMNDSSPEVFNSATDGTEWAHQSMPGYASKWVGEALDAAVSHETISPLGVHRSHVAVLYSGTGRRRSSTTCLAVRMCCADF